MECPICGQDLPKNLVSFDLGAGVIISKGKTIALTPKEAELFEILWRGKPRTVSKALIHENLYLMERDAKENIIDVFVCKLRKKLKGTGIRLLTDWGRGFHIEC